MYHVEDYHGRDTRMIRQWLETLGCEFEVYPLGEVPDTDDVVITAGARTDLFSNCISFITDRETAVTDSCKGYMHCGRSKSSMNFGNSHFFVKTPLDHPDISYLVGEKRKSSELQVRSCIQFYKTKIPNSFERFLELRGLSNGDWDLGNYGGIDVEKNEWDLDPYIMFEEVVRDIDILVHIKDHGHCCNAVMESLTYGIPVFMDIDTFFWGGYDRIQGGGIQVFPDIQSIADELNNITDQQLEFLRLGAMETQKELTSQQVYQNNVKSFQSLIENL